MDGTLKLTKKPDWDCIEEVRMECEEFFNSHHCSENISHSLVMIVSELMENSIKYGDFSAGSSMIQIAVKLKTSSAIIELVNPTGSSNKKELQNLDRTIQWIRGYQDPFEAFLERLRNVSKMPLDDSESGLGLVRIAYEGKAVLDFYVDENNLLNVSAIVDFV